MKAKYKTYNRSKNSKFTQTFTQLLDMDQLKAFIGLLYLQGLFKSGNEDVRSLWATDGTGRDIFRATMSLPRFLFILYALRFDDAITRKERLKTDKLAAVSNIFNKYVSMCNANYCPGPNVTIDEMLVAFRGRCSFKMYIPSKPAKYGIKIQIMADSETHYMVNAEIYSGADIQEKSKEKIKDRPAKKLSKPTEVVLRLTVPIVGSNRNVTGDNWYSSVEVVTELKECNLTYVGTMKKNKGKQRYVAKNAIYLFVLNVQLNFVQNV